MISGMRVGFISEWFDPEGGSAAVPGAMARGLAKAGCEIEVLTGFPNYPQGKIFEGYKQKPIHVEIQEGIAVRRVPLFPNHSDSALARASSYASFAFSSAVFGLSRMSPCDVYFVYSTPVTVGLAPLIRKFFKDTRIVTFIPDLWPDTLLEADLVGSKTFASTALNLAARYSEYSYRRSNALVASTDRMRKELIHRGHEELKVSTVHTWFDKRITAESDTTQGIRESIADGRFLVMYAGNLGPLQDVENILDAAELLKHRREILFVFVGTGTLENILRERAEKSNLDNVLFLGARRPDEMSALIAQSNVQIVSLIDRPLFRMTIPGKLQFVMASSKPVIAAMNGEAADLVRDSNGGLVVEPGSPHELAAAVIKMAEATPFELYEMGKNSKDFSQRTFSEEIGVKKLTRILESVMENKS